MVADTPVVPMHGVEVLQLDVPQYSPPVTLHPIATEEDTTVYPIATPQLPCIGQACTAEVHYYKGDCMSSHFQLQCG